MKYHILHIEDSKTDADLIKRLIQKSGMKFSYHLASDKEEVMDALNLFNPNIVLCDHSLPAFNSKIAYGLCKEKNPFLPFILVTGSISEEFAVDMLKTGVDDYLLKTNLQRLPLAIENAVSKRDQERKMQALRAELSDSETQLRTFFENVTVGLILLDRNCRILEMNNRTKYYSKIAFGRALVKNENLFEFIPVYRKEELGKHFQKTLQGERIQYKSVYAQQDGSVVTFNVKLSPTIQSDGTVAGICISLEDISERKTAEYETKRLTERLVLATQSAQLGIWEWDLKTNSLAWDQGMYKLYNIGEKKLGSVYHGWLSRLLPSDKTKVERALQDAVLGIKEYDTSFRIQWDDLSIHHIRATGLVDRDAAGNAIGMIGANWDITKISKNEELIRKSEIFDRNLLNSITDHIAVLNENGAIVAVNNVWKQFGLDNGETRVQRIAIGANYFEVCEKSAAAGDAIAARMLEGMKNVLTEKEKVFYTEYPCNSPDKERWFGVRVVKFESDEQLIVAIHSDITERKLAEIYRFKITNDLIQRNRDLEQFTFIVSHNLRAPTANIMGFAEFLQDETLTPQEQKACLNGLATSVNGLDSVIKDINIILNVKNELKVKKETISFSKLVQDIFDAMGNLIENDNVHLTSDFSAVDEIYSIKPYMYSIFYNLISNSIKYAKPDKPCRIAIKSKNLNGKVVLTFKDNGLGIDLNGKDERLFGLYERFHSHVPGKGMGLYMVKTQVQALGGTITLASTINKGTSFTITF